MDIQKDIDPPVDTVEPPKETETEKSKTPADPSAPQEEVIDEQLMDGLAEDLEEKLNLTAGERTNGIRV